MKKIQIIITALGCSMITACSDNELNEQTQWKEGQTLELAASINETSPARADGEPDLPTGNYYFSYVKVSETSAKYSTIGVKFEDGEGIDYFTVNENTEQKQSLTWSDVKTTLSNTVFVLDNVPPLNWGTTFTSSTSTIDLTDNSNSHRYDAGPAPETPGEGNDLLWGTVNVKDVSSSPLSPVHFKLEHRMSMLTFEINSEDPTIQALLNKDNAKVELYQVIIQPATFNRLTGDITIADNAQATEAIELEIAKNAENKESAITESWIFPPQGFYETTPRPVLKITLKNQGEEKIFQGVLPESMLYEEVNCPLEFLPGCHLTVEVELGDWENLDINFRPVLVKKWDEKDPDGLNAKQLGVYAADELEELVEAYTGDVSKKNLTLWKYGILSDNTWTFYLWKDLTIESTSPAITTTDSTIKLNFNTISGYSFKFESNGHTITYKGIIYKINESGTLTEESTTNEGE